MKPGFVFLSVALLLAGGLLGQLVRADAQASANSFRECVGARTWGYAGDDINKGEPFKKTLKIPAGWTPIGGGSYPNGDGFVILCR